MSQQTASDPNKIVVKNARLSFSAIFAPRKGMNDGENKDPKYSASLILNKEDQAEMIKEVRRVIKQVASAKWPNKAVTNKPDGKLIAGDASMQKVMLLGICLHDGGEKADKDGYGDGVMYISASRNIKDNKGTEMPPLPVVDTKGKPVDPKSGLVYDGCRVHASIRIWAQDNDFGKRINAELRAVAFFKDDEPFGNGPVNAKSEFGNLLEEDEFADEAPKQTARPGADLDDL